MHSANGQQPARRCGVWLSVSGREGPATVAAVRGLAWPDRTLEWHEARWRTAQSATSLQPTSLQPKSQPHAPPRRWATPERGCLFDSYDAYREHSESHDPTLPEPLLLRPSSPGDAELLLSCSLLQRSCSVHGAAEEPSRDLACSLLQRFADSAVAGGDIAAVRVLLVSRCASLPFGAPRTPPPEL